MPADRSRPWLPAAARAAAVAGVLVWSWFASGVRTFTRPAEVLTFIPAVAVLLVTLWPRRAANQRVQRQPGPPYSTRGVALWLTLLAAMLGWELYQLVSTPRERHPTISSLLNTVISTHPSRLAGYLLWLVAGGLLVGDLLGRAAQRRE